jgi:hypothetical protein
MTVIAPPTDSLKSLLSGRRRNLSLTIFQSDPILVASRRTEGVELCLSFHSEGASTRVEFPNMDMCASARRQCLPPDENPNRSLSLLGG